MYINTHTPTYDNSSQKSIYILKGIRTKSPCEKTTKNSQKKKQRIKIDQQEYGFAGVAFFTHCNSNDALFGGLSKMQLPMQRRTLQLKCIFCVLAFLGSMCVRTVVAAVVVPFCSLPLRHVLLLTTQPFFGNFVFGEFL